MTRATAASAPRRMARSYALRTAPAQAVNQHRDASDPVLGGVDVEVAFHTVAEAGRHRAAGLCEPDLAVFDEARQEARDQLQVALLVEHVGGEHAVPGCAVDD